MRPPSIPFTVLALAPFRPKEDTPWPHDPVHVDRTNLDEVIERFGLSLTIPLPQNLLRADRLSLNIKRMKDFHPDSLIENNPLLKNLLDARQFAGEAKGKGLSEETIHERIRDWPGIPSDIKPVQLKPKERLKSSVDDILKMVSLPDDGSTSPAETQTVVGQIDAILQQIAGHLFSSEDLRNLESVWRGLRFLLKQEGLNGEAPLKIVPLSFETLEETLNSLRPGLIQDLPSLVLIDLPFDSSPRSLDLLEKVAAFSETLMVPTIFWITPKFLYLDSWGDLARLPYLPHYFDEQKFARWRTFRDTPPAGWLAAACNRFLVRYPYGPDNRSGRIYFTEPQGLFASTVWGMGSLIVQSLSQTGWPTRFTSWQDIRLPDLPLIEIGDNKSLSTEALLSDDRIDQFVQAGIIPLVAPINKDTAFTPLETTISGGSFCHQLFLSRVTHFLFWCKDNFEHDLEPAEVEKGLYRSFSLFWEKTGHSRPEDLEISVTRPKPDQPATVRFAVIPSRKILPSGAQIELEFRW